jgi:hypothetical protein
LHLFVSRASPSNNWYAQFCGCEHLTY